jgi:hypothetical protein
MFRRLRTLVVLSAVAAAAVVVGTGPAPSGAGISSPVVGSGTAYTVEFAVPNGISGDRCRLSTVDLATGAVTPIGPIVVDQLGCAFDLALSPGGALYGISDVDDEVDPPSVDGTSSTTDGPVAQETPLVQVHLVRFDTTTGAVTDVGAIGTAASYANGAGGVTFDARGNLYVYMVGDDPQCDGIAYCLYQVDPANPASATFLGSDPEETNLFGLTASCSTGMYTIADAERGGSVDPADDVYSIRGGDQLDAVEPTPPAKATAVGGLIGTGRRIQSIDFAADGTLWALGSTESKGLPSARLSVLDRTTGEQRLGQTLSSDIETVVFGLAISTPSCPVEIEPAFTG